MAANNNEKSHILTPLPTELMHLKLMYHLDPSELKYFVQGSIQCQNQPVNTLMAAILKIGRHQSD